MADSDTTQQKSFHARLAELKKITVSLEAAAREARAAMKKEIAEAMAAAREVMKKAEAREAMKKAEAREAMKKAAAREAMKKAEAREGAAREAAAREANYIPFFTTIQWLGVAGLAVSLQALFTSGR